LLVVFIAVILDFTTGKVSNKLILIGLLFSFIFAVILGENNGLIYYLLGVITPIVTLLLLFIIGGIGAGDVKLFAVIGGFIGYQGAFRCIIVAFVIGAVISLGKILIYKRLTQSFRNIIQYVFRVYQTQQIQVYERENSNTIHFTLPILLSVLCYIGGII
jgi:prepilin peptidase CpaA